MKVVVHEGLDIQEDEVVIRCHQNNEDIAQLKSYIQRYQDHLICKRNNSSYSIRVSEIYYIESVDNKTFAYTKEHCFEVNHALYELESLLKDNQCIRISKSCILNIHYLKSVKALFNGKYEALLINDEKVIVSRKYVPNLKKAFGL